MKTLHAIIGKLRIGLFGLAVLALVALPENGLAQVQSWHIGQGGLSWDSQAEQQVGAVSVDGGLQPLEIIPGENLTQLLAGFGQKWQSEPPADYTRGGQPHTWTNSHFFNVVNGPLGLVDGDPETSTEEVFKSSGNPAGTAFFWDLGAAYPINRVRFYPNPEDPDAYMEAFDLSTNNGANFDGSRPIYTRLRRVENNDDEVVEVEFTTLNARFIQLKNLSRAPFDLAEMEIYGQGFIPASSYVSELHSFGGPVNFRKLFIEATRLGSSSDGKDASPTCILQVRSGADDTPLSYFRRDRETGTEEEISVAEYENQLPRLAFFRQDPNTGRVIEEMSRTDYLALPLDEQGAVRDFVQGSIRTDSENWSPWSGEMKVDSTEAYEFILSLPGPHSYLQFRLFFAGDAENAMRIDSFRLEYSPLLASGAVGEVALAADPSPENGLVTVPSGVDTTFIYDIRADFAEDGLEGFNGVKLAAFPPPSFEGLEIGNPFAPVEEFEIEATEDGFQVFFPTMGRQNNQPIRITFKQKVLEHNTPVDAWLLGADGGLPQPVAAGNASDQVTTNARTIFTIDPQPALKIDLSRTILTPNGDGVNDGLDISYVLIQFGSGVQVDVDIYDLSGRRVRQLFSGPLSAGDHGTVWDGRSDGGVTVSPGSYLCRVKVEGQARAFETTQVVGVVY